MAREKGRDVMWCADCDTWFPIDVDHWRNVCPRCGRYLRVWKCMRCSHMWVPRSEKLSDVCPACHSRYWHRTRVVRRR